MPMDADLVVDHMLALPAKYGARHIFFADEAMTPRNLKVMSARWSRSQCAHVLVHQPLQRHGLQFSLVGPVPVGRGPR